MCAAAQPAGPPLLPAGVGCGGAHAAGHAVGPLGARAHAGALRRQGLQRLLRQDGEYLRPPLLLLLLLHAVAALPGVAPAALRCAVWAGPQRAQRLGSPCMLVPWLRAVPCLTVQVLAAPACLPTRLSAPAGARVGHHHARVPGHAGGAHGRGAGAGGHRHHGIFRQRRYDNQGEASLPRECPSCLLFLVPWPWGCSGRQGRGAAGREQPAGGWAALARAALHASAAAFAQQRAPRFS